MSTGTAGAAVVLVSHGTVASLDDLTAFVTNVRHGRPPSPELVAELRRRYLAIGGRSPLNAINAELARKLSAVLGAPVRNANRLWKPYVRDVLAELAGEGIRRVGVVPLAQYSTHVYAEDARKAAGETGVAIACAENWGEDPALCAAFARRLRESLAGHDPARTAVVMTAHSLPRAVIERGDPYERDVGAAAARVAQLAGASRYTLAFQSQGMSDVPGGGGWLGPDLTTAIDLARARGDTTVVLAPIGFLADHVEILYDLDIEAAAIAHDRGLRAVRVPSPNADDDLVAAVAGVARPLLEGGA